MSYYTQAAIITWMCLQVTPPTAKRHPAARAFGDVATAVLFGWFVWPFAFYAALKIAFKQKP